MMLQPLFNTATDLHETAKHLFCVLWWPRISKAYERTIDRCPCAPL